MLKIVSTLHDGSYRRLPTSFSFSFNCANNNLPYVVRKKSKISRILHWIMSTVASRNGCKYSSSIVSVICLRNAVYTVCTLLYSRFDSSWANFLVATSEGFSGVARTPSRFVVVKIPGLSGHKNGDVPGIALNFSDSIYSAKYGF